MMRRSILCLAILLIVRTTTVLASDQVAFNANFDLDTVGDWPNLDPPGAPAGDSMEIVSRWNGDDTTAFVQESWHALTNKPLVIDRHVGENIGFYFNLDPAYTECGTYTISWSGAAGNQLEFVYFTLREPGGRLLASLDYRAGGILTYNSSSNVLSTGWTESVVQDFRLEVDVINRASNLWIDGAPVPEAQDARLMVANPIGVLSLLTLNFGFSSAAIMAIDDFRVVAHCTDVANETVNWGMLKSAYR